MAAEQEARPDGEQPVEGDGEQVCVCVLHESSP
jgi:hypothetical protein